MSKNSEKENPNVVLSISKKEKEAARIRSIEVYNDYRSLSKYVRELIAYDVHHKIL